MKTFKVWIDGFGAPEEWEAESITDLLLHIRDAIVHRDMDEPRSALRIEATMDQSER